MEAPTIAAPVLGVLMYNQLAQFAVADVTCAALRSTFAVGHSTSRSKKEAHGVIDCYFGIDVKTKNPNETALVMADPLTLLGKYGHLLKNMIIITQAAAGANKMHDLGKDISINSIDVPNLKWNNLHGADPCEN
ncbi:hypothetical protein GGF32_005429 [Allomyces javanicus]|nr:hypothetical protein GGF32_005429 [Allomyces javanicus]